MAILGFLVHSTAEEAPAVEAALKSRPALTTYGIHQACYVVAVADAPAADLEAILEDVRGIDGVITCYVTSMSTEDEE